MDKITIYKNKGEVFECQFKIEGASIDETTVRLCLEFSNNKNMFFYGTIQEDGTCNLEIPVLKEIGNQQGKMIIEAIADATYFILYEAEVELKNSVEVSIVKKPTVESRKPKTNIKLEQITPVKPEKKVEKVVEQKKPANPYIPEKSQPGATQPPPPETTPGKLTRFGEWKASHEK